MATVVDDGKRLRLRDERHEISDITITFPKTLGVPTQQPVEPVIDSAAFRRALLAATERGKADQIGKLPALVRVSYWDGDTKRTTAAIYDIVWRTEGSTLGFIGGRSLKLEALRLRDRSASVAALDRMWTPSA